MEDESRNPHDWLVERFKERAKLLEDGDESGFAYVSGRVDEFCAQNGVDEHARARALAEAQGLKAV
jgi:hypothetical protein